jgi:hypothetical protein
MVAVKAGTSGAVVRLYQKSTHLGDVRITHFIGSNLMDDT